MKGLKINEYRGDINTKYLILKCIFALKGPNKVSFVKLNKAPAPALLADLVSIKFV